MIVKQENECEKDEGKTKDRKRKKLKNNISFFQHLFRWAKGSIFAPETKAFQGYPNLNFQNKNFFFFDDLLS